MTETAYGVTRDGDGFSGWPSWSAGDGYGDTNSNLSGGGRGYRQGDADPGDADTGPLYDAYEAWPE